MFLDKISEVTPEFKSIIESHCEIGYRIAAASPDLVHIAGDILSHHEQWDGNGYPHTFLPIILAIIEAYYNLTLLARISMIKLRWVL